MLLGILNRVDIVPIHLQPKRPRTLAWWRRVAMKK